MEKLVNRSMLEHILTEEDAKKLFGLEEENLAPGEKLPEGEYQEFIKDVIGKKLWEYCKWRWPEEPEEQLQLALEVLTFD